MPIVQKVWKSQPPCSPKILAWVSFTPPLFQRQIFRLTVRISLFDLTSWARTVLQYEQCPDGVALWKIRKTNNNTFLFHGATTPGGLGHPHCRGFTNTFRHTTIGRTPLEKRSARGRDLWDLYLKTYNSHNRQTFMHPVGLEPAIPASERPQTTA